MQKTSFRFDDTIAAISTALGGSGIGIVRISGSDAIFILSKIFKCNKRVFDIKSHTITYGHIVNEKKETIDEVLVSLMRAPKTYTTEDVVEINCHGGLLPVQAVLQEVLKNGARLAEAGEFTKRAFLNGRIDLAQSEAVIDIINAKTEMYRKAAVNQLKGGFSQVIKKLQNEILTLTAKIEVAIDYPEYEDEENTAEVSFDLIKDTCLALITEFEKLIASADSGRIIKEGIETVILGKPNVGKSSLLNSLLDYDRAIVTEIAGTTRDVLQEYISINGIPLKISDTAGIRNTDDIIEKIGVEKTKQCVETAELVLIVLDGTKEINQEDIDIFDWVFELGKKTIVLVNKSDLPQANNVYTKFENTVLIPISAKERTGLDTLYTHIKNMFFNGELNINDDTLTTNMRHKNSLVNGIGALKQTIDTIDLGLSLDLVSVDLQNCYFYLGEITGDTADDDLINKIFSEFCLGK